MSLTTTTEIAGPVNVKFQVALLRNAKALAPYFLGTTPAEIAHHQGTFTAKWRRIENLTAVTTPLAELTGSVSFPTRTGVQPTVTDLTATVEKFGNHIFLNEEVDLVNFNGQGRKLSELMGMNAGQSLNRLQRNIAEDNLTAIFSGTATTASDLQMSGAVTGGEMTLSVIAQTVNALNRQDALKFLPQTTGDRNIGTSPIRESYWGICHVDTTEDLRLLTGFQSVETYANQTETAPGEIGAVGGVRWIETTEASIDASSGFASTGSATVDARSAANGRADVYNTIVFGKDCLGSLGFGSRHVKDIYKIGDKLPAVMIINKPRGSAGAGDPYNEISTLAWKSWHTGLVLDSNWGRVVQHVVARLEVA
jgi:N4-gp56 family major capsid protein